MTDISGTSDVFPPSPSMEPGLQKPRTCTAAQVLTFFTKLSLSGAWSNRVSKASRSAQETQGEGSRTALLLRPRPAGRGEAASVPREVTPEPKSRRRQEDASEVPSKGSLFRHETRGSSWASAPITSEDGRGPFPTLLVSQYLLWVLRTTSALCPSPGHSYSLWLNRSPSPTRSRSDPLPQRVEQAF